MQTLLQLPQQQGCSGALTPEQTARANHRAWVHCMLVQENAWERAQGFVSFKAAKDAGFAKGC